MSTALFTLFSAVALGAALVVVTQRNPFTSAMGLVLCFFALSADYVLLQAPFVAVIQVLVYAGAIMVLFVFVIMLLNLREDEGLATGALSWRQLLALAFVLATSVAGLASAVAQLSRQPMAPVPERFGSVDSIGLLLMGGGYLLPLEATSVLLTVAMVGAVLLAKRHLAPEIPRPTPPEQG